MSNVVIRDFEMKDYSKVMEIENLTFVAPWNEKEMLYEINDNEFSLIGVATIDEQVVGFYDFWITFDSATIAQIAVHPSYQHLGIGSLMMKEILKECSIKKVNNITLEVRKNNVKAINFYEKHGFITRLTKEKYYSNGDDALYMIKEVTVNG